MSLLRRLHNRCSFTRRQASGAASPISAIPTSTCIQPSSVRPGVGVWRSSHSSPNHSASQKTAPATPVGGLRLHHLGLSCCATDSGACCIVLLTLFLTILALFLPRHGQSITRRREVRACQQQQP